MTNIYKNSKLAAKFVNLTAVNTLRTYDEKGNVCKMKSNKHTYVVDDISSILECEEPYTYFVLSKDMAAVLCKICPQLDNIAVIKRWGIGRDNRPVAYFVSAQDRNVPVRLYKRAATAGFPHL